MPQVKIWFVVALAFAVAAGCASSGRQFDTTHVNEIQVGAQDKSQIIKWFGEPFSRVNLGENPKNCAERWTWVHAKAVGFGSVTKSESLVVDFNSDGKVCDNAFSKLK